MMRERRSKKKEKSDDVSEDELNIDTPTLEEIEKELAAELNETSASEASIPSEVPEQADIPVGTTEQGVKQTLQQGKTAAITQVQTTPRQAVQEDFEAPTWVKKPWMYARPRKPSQLNSWLESWGDLIVDYAAFYELHLLNLVEHGKQHPFTNKKTGKKLTLRELQEIGSNLEVRELAQWWNDRRTTLRVLWKSLDEWALEIEDYLLESGLMIEVITIADIQNVPNQTWATLPEEDLRAIFSGWVEKGKADWIGSTRSAIKFRI